MMIDMLSKMGNKNDNEYNSNKNNTVHDDDDDDDDNDNTRNNKSTPLFWAISMINWFEPKLDPISQR